MGEESWHGQTGFLGWRSFPGHVEGIDWTYPCGASGKEPTCQCRRPKRHRFDPCVEKVPWIRKRKPTPILAWRIPWAEEPGGLQSIWLQSVRHNWSNLTCMHANIVTLKLHIYNFSKVPWGCFCWGPLSDPTLPCSRLGEWSLENWSKFTWSHIEYSWIKWST